MTSIFNINNFWFTKIAMTMNANNFYIEYRYDSIDNFSDLMCNGKPDDGGCQTCPF